MLLRLSRCSDRTWQPEGRLKHAPQHYNDGLKCLQNVVSPLAYYVLYQRAAVVSRFGHRTSNSLNHHIPPHTPRIYSAVFLPATNFFGFTFEPPKNWTWPLRTVRKVQGTSDWTSHGLLILADPPIQSRCAQDHFHSIAQPHLFFEAWTWLTNGGSSCSRCSGTLFMDPGRKVVILTSFSDCSCIMYRLTRACITIPCVNVSIANCDFQCSRSTYQCRKSWFSVSQTVSYKCVDPISVF
jgi:hypothetical protein